MEPRGEMARRAGLAVGVGGNLGPPARDLLDEASELYDWVRTGSAGDRVKLWAPQWCIGLATKILERQKPMASLVPPNTKTQQGKTIHYDPMRACVIVCVSACVIATASAR